MDRIRLTPEQAEIVAGSIDPVELCDAQGNVLGRIIPPKLEAIIAESKRRAREPGPRYSSEQTREMLRTLEETWEREGPFDEQRAIQIVSELRAKWNC
jgi:hypothetical protein